MKFLNFFCDNRNAEAYISLDKIVLIKKPDEQNAYLIELQELTSEPVKTTMLSEDLIRKVKGHDRVSIGFRRPG